jgi:hypothetical protein
LRHVERLCLGPELLGARLGIALDRALLALRRADARLHALALVAQRLQAPLELRIDRRPRLARRRAHVDAADREAARALALDADRGRIEGRRQTAQDEGDTPAARSSGASRVTTAASGKTVTRSIFD